MTVAAQQPRKRRGPSKKTRELLAAAREQGIVEGLNLAAAQPTGLLRWVVLALVVGGACGAWWF